MKTFFAENLKYLRKLNNITQYNLSLHMHKKHTTIGNWEKNISRPNIEELVEIAKYFNVNVDSFLLEDLTDIKGNKKHFEKNETEEVAIPVKDIYSDKLIESLQLNVQTLQQIVATKTAEVQQLQNEISFLKQNHRRLRVEH